MKIFLKIVKGFFTGLFLFLFILITGLNVSKRFILFDYYNKYHVEGKIVGLNENFIPQGLGYSEEEDLTLQSGYLVGSNHCVIYLIDSKGKSKRINIVNEDGSPYVGHCGGISVYKDFVYVSEDFIDGDYDVSNRLYIFSLTELLNTKNKGNIVNKNYITVDAEGAFVSNDGKYVYVGEYYYPKSFETEKTHHVTTPNNIEQKAFVCAYEIDESKENFLGELAYQISIPDIAQGFALQDGVCVISRSWGPAISKLGFYEIKESDMTSSSSGKEVPLYYVDDSTLIKNVKIPPMSEGVFIKDNRVFVYFESAGNKYIFGKLFNAYNIISYPFITK